MFGHFKDFRYFITCYVQFIILWFCIGNYKPVFLLLFLLLLFLLLLFFLLLFLLLLLLLLFLLLFFLLLIFSPVSFFSSSSSLTPNQFINQFPSENVITCKDLMASVARRATSGSPDSTPKWLPETFNLFYELPRFVHKFKSLESKSVYY